jgi:hypothetical protein
MTKSNIHTVLQSITNLITAIATLLGVVVAFLAYSAENSESKKLSDSDFEKPSIVETVSHSPTQEMDMAFGIEESSAFEPIYKSMSAPKSVSNSPLVSDKPIGNYKVIHDGPTYWAKVGYFLNTDGDFIISPRSISSSSATISIADSNNNLIKNESIKVGDSMQVTHNGKSYRISLVSIGTPGFNILKKACYFRVEVIM